MFKKRPSVEEVFTPRQAQVNPNMYVERPQLEMELIRALKGSLHVIVHGESGGGKSWLYKRVLESENAVVRVANCANAVRFNSIASELQNLLDRNEKARQISHQDSVGGEVNLGIAKGDSNRTATYEIGKKEPLEAVLKDIRENARDNQLAVLVFDNLESLLKSEPLIRELANIIVLLDDERYASYNVKILIVGVPADIRAYFSKLDNLATVANRLQEITEVSRLDAQQVAKLVYKGFIEELKINVPSSVMETWQHHVFWVTDGIPQKVHEYCAKLAYACEDNGWDATNELLSKADKQWLSQSLVTSYSIVENAMNDRATKLGRRNQVLYALGRLLKRSFGVSDVEEIVRQDFPDSTEGITLAISQTLTYLAKLENPILTRTTKGNEYRFADPSYVMCIRSMLHKDGDVVQKVEVI